MTQFALDGMNYPRFRDIPGAVYARSGVQYQQNQAGLLVPFDEDVPPISAGVGVDLWESRTNSIRNPTGLGAVSGTPGTLPTNWAFGTVAGINTTVTTGVIIGGKTGISIRFFGTNTSGATAYPAIQFETTTGIPAATGQDWTVSVEAAIIDGSPTNGFSTTPRLGLNEHTAAGAYVGVQSGLAGQITATVPTILSVKYTTVGGATVGMVRPYLVMGVNNGYSIDVTYWIAWANCKQGTDIKDPPVLQTNNAVATRGAPSMYINASSLLNAPYTVQLWANLAPIDGTLRRFATIAADVDETNQIVFERTAGNQLAIQAITANVAQTRAAFINSYTGPRLIKLALRVRPTGYQAAVDGVLQGEKTITIPSVSRLVLGTRASLGSNPINGRITRFQIINRDLSDAELRALTTWGESLMDFT